MTRPPNGYRYERFFAELKRRRVFNAAAIYGGAAFVIFQAADFVVPALRLPESVSTAIVLISVFAFPFAMVLAWFYDVTTRGVRRTDPPDPGELEAIVAQPRLRRWPMGIAAASGVALLLGGFGWHIRDRADPRGAAPLADVPATASVAVLPFLNLIDDGESTYLSEGIANELLEALRRVPGLRVTGRVSALSFRNSGIAIASVADQLHVGAVVDGSVGDAGDQVEIAVRLVVAGDGDQGWSKSYLLPKEGFLIALDGVARSIAGQLGVEVPAEGGQPLVLPSTGRFAAYRDYLRGRQLSYQATPDALESAIKFYGRALLLDPDFASAWAALATAYLLLPESGGPRMADLLPYVQAALEQATKPGRETAEGYAGSGYLRWAYLWDLPTAEGNFRMALELDPQDPVSRYWYAEFLASRRRWEEGLAQANKALELDPLSAAAHFTRGLVLFCAGLDGASISFRRALELAPDMHPASFILAGELAMEGELEGAAEEFDRYSFLTGTDPSVFRAYLTALSDSTKKPEAVAALETAGFLGAFQGAELLAQLGETDAALSLLERAARDRSPHLPWVNAMPQFKTLRSESRFQSILAFVGF